MDTTPADPALMLRSLVAPELYPCLGARSVVKRGQARVRRYAALGATSASPVLRDLSRFGVDVRDDPRPGFASFVAIFDGPAVADEEHFERLLWDTLAGIAAQDTESWDAAVSADPQDRHFAFSAAGVAYFVVGLHPAASRPARRTPAPMLVFNPHAQFDRLRASGKYLSLRDTIRRRDLVFTGSLNPMLSDHGQESEARQYAGRAVEPWWAAPLPAGLARRTADSAVAEPDEVVGCQRVARAAS